MEREKQNASARERKREINRKARERRAKIRAGKREASIDVDKFVDYLTQPTNKPTRTLSRISMFEESHEKQRARVHTHTLVGEN